MTDSPFLPDEDARQDEPTPWGFRITLVAVVVYLAYRFGQGVVWLWQAVVG